MPQFRQNFITKEWVIVAPERAKRPDQFSKGKEPRNVPPHDPNCPFCPGNEHMTPSAIMSRDHGKEWCMRVVPNKFAAVNPDTTPERHKMGRYLAADGFGIAEVVIESPAHDATLALMKTEEVKNVIQAYRTRYSGLAENPNIDMVTIFRNHGKAAGTSLIHPHSQIIATPIVPPHIRQLMQQALLYHDTYGCCPYCVMIEEEISQGHRIVAETKSFVAFCPFASHVPFEIRIMPKRHSSRFDCITDDETTELADLLRTTLKKLYTGLNDPDYNFVINTSPTSDGELHYEHWRLTIVPKLTTPAGFEIGSGIFINIMPPEEGAAFLRSVAVS